MSKEKLLFEHCKKFIEEMEISCSETIFQCDRVILNAGEFIEGVCDIVGYVDLDDEDDD